MEERFVEVRFCIFIDSLLKTFKYSIKVIDVIEAYCALGNIEDYLIKKLIKQIKDKSGSICTYKEEATYLYKQMGYSMRDIYKLTGISTSTQLKLNKYLLAHPQMYEGLQPHLDTLEHEAVVKFMRVVDVMSSLHNS